MILVKFIYSNGASQEMKFQDEAVKAYSSREVKPRTIRGDIWAKFSDEQRLSENLKGLMHDLGATDFSIQRI